MTLHEGQAPVEMSEHARIGSTRRGLLKGAALAGGLSAAAIAHPESALASAPSDWINVKLDYGAQGDGSTDDTTAVQNAITAANSSTYGGVVYFPPGVYTVGLLTISSNVYLRGAGVGATVIKLRSGKNSDLIQTTGFATQTTQQHFGLLNLSLDGNQVSNPTGGVGLKIYGKCFFIHDVHIHHCTGTGLYSQWSGGGTDMEAHLSAFKIYDWSSPA
jgi:polygalacturonase